MDDGSDSFYAVRKAGSGDEMYARDRDILFRFPEMLVKGAAFAVDPGSWIYQWLVNDCNVSDGYIVHTARENVSYLLKVLQECKTADLIEVFAQNKVDPVIHNAIMMGMGSMFLRLFNTSFRKWRLTQVKTGKITEPTKQIDEERCMAIFDSLVKRTRRLE